MKKEIQMKALTAMIAITLIAFTARGSEPVPSIAMPVGIGYAIDAKCVRQPNALCLRDAVFAPHRNIPMGAVPRSRYLDAGHSRGRTLPTRCRSENRSSQPSHNNKIDRISETGRCQHKRIQTMGFQTRHVERNHHAHHRAQKWVGMRASPR